MSTVAGEAKLLLEDLQVALQKLGDERSNIAPLRVAVAAKRLETVAKLLTERTVEAASAEFGSLEAGGKKVPYHGGFLSAYTAPVEWSWPLEIVTLERQLKELKERAKANGAATSTKKADAVRNFKVEAPFAGSSFEAYLDGAKALEKLL